MASWVVAMLREDCGFVASLPLSSVVLYGYAVLCFKYPPNYFTRITPHSATARRPSIALILS